MCTPTCYGPQRSPSAYFVHFTYKSLKFVMSKTYESYAERYGESMFLSGIRNVFGVKGGCVLAPLLLMLCVLVTAANLCTSDSTLREVWISGFASQTQSVAA